MHKDEILPTAIVVIALLVALVAGLFLLTPEPTQGTWRLVPVVDVCSAEHPPVPCKGAFQ